MFRSSLLASVVAATMVRATPQPAQLARRQDEAATTPTAAPTPTINPEELSSFLSSYLGGMTMSPLVPSPSVTLGLSIPESLQYDIMTAVPATAVIQLLVDEAYREIIAADFEEGNPPSWYDDLDPELQTFFQTMAESIANGEAIVTQTPTETGVEGEGEVEETSVSDDVARPTGASKALMAGAVGVAGVLGIALTL